MDVKTIHMRYRALTFRSRRKGFLVIVPLEYISLEAGAIIITLHGKQVWYNDAHVQIFLIVIGRNNGREHIARSPHLVTVHCVIPAYYLVCVLI